jgi:NDP-sugar pyrophosphorylase family protein
MSSFINLLVKKNKKVGVCPIHENWLDIGSHSDLNKVT